MIESNSDFSLLSGDPFEAGGQSPSDITLLGGTNAPLGSVVIAGYDDADPLLTAGKVNGPNSYITTCKVPVIGDASLYALCGIVESDAEHIAGANGPIALGRKTVLALVQVPIGGLLAHAPLMVDFADANLEVAAGTAKCVGLMAAPADDNAGAAIVRLVPVRFSGTYGWGG